MKRVLLFLLFISSCSVFSQTIDEIIKNAELNFKNKKYNEALESYNKAILIDSTNSNLFYKRAKVNYSLKKYQNTQNDYSKAIMLNPKFTQAYNDRAFFYYSLDYFEYAISDCNAALLHIDNDISLKNSILNTRADCYVLTENYEKAIGDYSYILKNKSIDAYELNSLVNIAKALDKLNRTEEAITYLERLIKVYPKFIAGYINLAFQYSKIGDYKKAIMINDKALSVLINNSKNKENNVLKINNKVETIEDDNQTYAVILNNRGFSKYKIGDYSNALKDINKSLGLMPDNSYAYKNRALVYFATKKYELGCNDIQKALEFKFTEHYGNEVLLLKEEYCDK